MNTSKIISIGMIGLWTVLLSGCTSQNPDIANGPTMPVASAEYIIDASDMGGGRGR